MDDTRSFSNDGDPEQDFPAAAEPRMDEPPFVDVDERRMHVRAYNYWVSLLDGRPYPSIEDLDPSNLADFGPHSVLVDFTAGPEHAAIAYLGATLRNEGEIGSEIHAVADVPPRSVLSRLTDHYLQIIANCAPIGFEAEYVNHRGRPTMYRGILMPFSSDGDTIDFIYGVINWKEIAEEEIDQDIREAVNSVLSDPVAHPAVVAPIWADGPHSQPLHDEDEPAQVLASDAGLYEWLAAAREAADALAGADQRSRAALYRALGQAYDFALAAETDPANYAEILADADLKVQDRAPMTPIVKLVFGATYDKTRLAEYAAVLAHGYRHNLGAGTMPAFIEAYDGGLKGVVKAERAFRRPAAKSDREAIVRQALADAPALATVMLAGIDSDYIAMIGRREPDGSIAILTATTAQSAQLVRAGKDIA